MRLLFLIFIALISSCATKHSITYNLSDVHVTGKEPLPISISIDVFQDYRPYQLENVFFLVNNNKATHDNKYYCINSERNYDTSLVAFQISQQIANHFDKLKLFSNVKFDNENSSDYILTGKIFNFYAKQEFIEYVKPLMDKVPNIERLLNGSVAYNKEQLDNVVAPTDIFIKFTDVKILDSKGIVKIELGDYELKHSKELGVDHDCLLIYYHVNYELKSLIDNMATDIYNKLTENRFWKKQ